MKLPDIYHTESDERKGNFIRESGVHIWYICEIHSKQQKPKTETTHTLWMQEFRNQVKSTVPDRPPSTLMPCASSPCSLSFGFLLLFTGSGGACSPPNWSCRLARPGLGFIVGGRLNRLLGLNSEVPLVGCSPTSFCALSCLLNLFTIRLTFPSETLLLMPRSPGGGEPDCEDGFGGISGRGLASGLKGEGDVARWIPSWTDMVAGVLCFCVFHSQLWPIRGQTLRKKVTLSMLSSPDELREKKSVREIFLVETESC